MNFYFHFILYSSHYYFFFKAARNGYHEVVEKLLEYNANIESTDINGCTPLICGICFNELFIFPSNYSIFYSKLPEMVTMEW